MKYVQPGIIIYVNHSFLLLNFIIGLYLYSKRTNTPLTTLCCSFELIQSSLIDASGWSRKDALKKTTWLAFLYFVPNLFWAASLNYIPVSISVAMQQSQCGFVYLLGVYWSVIPANRIKSIACVFCILGVILISVGTIMAADDSDKNGSSSSGKTGDDDDGASNNNRSSSGSNSQKKVSKAGKRACTVPECNKYRTKRGLCNEHHQKFVEIGFFSSAKEDDTSDGGISDLETSHGSPPPQKKYKKQKLSSQTSQASFLSQSSISENEDSDDEDD